MNDFYKIISNVADKEMVNVGQDIDRSIPNTAAYIECVRRIQIWTLEELEKIATDDIMGRCFKELADGIRRVPDIDLWMGEPGADGQ